MEKPRISIDRAYSLFKTSYLKNDGMLDDENFNELMEETIEKGQRVDIQKRVQMGTYLKENYEDEIEYYYDYYSKPNAKAWKKIWQWKPIITKNTGDKKWNLLKVKYLKYYAVIAY